MTSALSLITGGTGFIGQALFNRLHSKGVCVRGTSRHPVELPGKWDQVAELGPDTDWSAALRGCDVVVHTAGRAHVLRERGGDPLAEFRRVNVEGTLALARQALDAGVRRFVFISSIGVNGAQTVGEHAFTELDTPHPVQAYARSKWEAEQGLRTLLAGQAMELVIIRPPLVYASHAPGNFARLLGLVGRRLPLPLGCVDNARSMIALQNLLGFIELCLEHPAAAGETFVVADGKDFSTAQLVELLAQGMGDRARLLPVPVWMLRSGLAVTGRKAMGQQLCGSLQVDASKAYALLGWTPEISAQDALLASALQWKQAR